MITRSLLKPLKSVEDYPARLLRSDLRSSNLYTKAEPPTVQRILPGNTYAWVEFSICFFFESCTFPLHCTHIFLISFPRLTKNIDFGHKRVLSREVRGLFFLFVFFFSFLFYFDTVCFKMSFKLFAFLGTK